MKKSLYRTIIFIIMGSLVLGAFLIFLIWNSLDRPGIANNVEISIGSSERFTLEEIESAMDIVIADFSLMNSELIYLWYDEDISNFEFERSYMFTSGTIEKEDVMILLSTIDVNRNGGPGFLSPGIMENLAWVLVRDGQFDQWEIKAVGFSGINF